MLKLVRYFSTNKSINQYNKSNILSAYNDLVKNRQMSLSLKLPCYQTKKYSNENDYNRSLKNITKRDLICLDGYTANNVEIADVYDRTNNYLYHIKRGTKNIRVLSSQIVNGALLLHYYQEQKYLLNNQLINQLNNQNINNKMLIDIDKYVKMHKIDIINSEYAYVFGIIIPQKYNINNISLNSQLSIGITCNILRSLNIKYYIDFIPQI